MSKCPECGKEIDHILQTWTAYNHADVTLNADGSINWGTTETGSTDDNVYRCPECDEEMDLSPWEGEDYNIDEGIKNFLAGITLEDLKNKKQEEKDKKEQWQRRQIGRTAMDTPNLDYSILSKNAEKKVEPKKEMVQIVRKASLNTKNHPRLPRLIVERKKVVLSEEENF